MMVVAIGWRLLSKPVLALWCGLSGHRFTTRHPLLRLLTCERCGTNWSY